MPMTDFGAMLDALIRERCRTAAAFCEAVEAAGYRCHRGDVSAIINGREPVRRPPKDSAELDAWCAALHLTTKEAKAFRFEALLAHSPQEIADWVHVQIPRATRHRQQVADLNAQIADLSARLEELASRLPPAANDV